MSRQPVPVRPDLPAHARQFLTAVRKMEPPLDTVDAIMAEVENTPQIRVWNWQLPVLAAAAAAVILAVLVLRLLPQNVGPAPTPVPVEELPSAGSVIATISVEGGDTPAAFGHDQLWIANARTGELVRMAPESGSIATPLRIREQGGMEQTMPVAVDSASVWVFDASSGSVVEVDPELLEERRRLSLPLVSATAMVSDGTSLWLADPTGGAVLRIDLANGAVAYRTPLQAASVVVLADGSLWAAGGAFVVELDPATGEERARVDVGAPVRAIAALDPGRLLVAREGSGVVRVDRQTMAVAAEGPLAAGIAILDGRPWAALSSGHLARLDPDTLQPVASVQTDLESLGGVLGVGGSLWAIGLDGAGDSYLVQMESGGE